MPDKAETYSDKRSFDETPEPQPEIEGNVDPGTAPAGKSFVIQQHHARRLHFDLRLEMMNGDVPVLVSWAVPRNLPRTKGKPHLAVHVEDHPVDYATFSGSIPAGNYGAGEVRIFDSGTFELLEQEPGKVTFRLDGERMKGVWHLFRTRDGEEKDWLVTLGEWDRPEPDPPPELAPMLATLVRDPFDHSAWIFEPKWDGVRALATCADETMLISRRGRDMTATYPELARLHERIVAIDAIVDGEIVAMTDGRPSFELLQGRMNLQNPHEVERAMKKIPVCYIAYDLIYLDGRSLVSEPLEKRKELLEQVLVTSERIQLSTSIEGSGVALFEAARAQNLEGIVAKKLGSVYHPGRRSKEWLKVKTVHEADVVVGGWSRGEGSRSSSFGALLVGAYDDEGLRFIGSVGTGFSEERLDALRPLLAEAETDESPFLGDPRALTTGRFGKPIRDPHWAHPFLVATVEFREFTAGGRLRAPSFKGLRTDKRAEDCRLDSLLPPPPPS